MFGNKWTEEELTFLKENYWDKGQNWCANKLGRTPDSVGGKARSLGLEYCGVKPKYRKENLERVVKESVDTCEVLSKLGLKCGGDNYSFIKKHIERNNIDTSHFVSPEEKKKTQYNDFFKAKPLEEVMVKNSSYSRNHLKRRIVNENIIEYKCVGCGNEGEWNGKPLSLHLDHINGVNNDHRYENLRFLCPNCHSQTKTYAGKVNKVDRRYSNHNGLTENQKEFHKNRRKTDRPSYEQLISDINSLGYMETGRKYGVSDNAVRKWKKWHEKHEVVDIPDESS